MAQIALLHFLDKHYGSMLNSQNSADHLERKLYEIRHRSHIASPQYAGVRVASSRDRGGAERTATQIVALEEKIAVLRMIAVYDQWAMWAAASVIQDAQLRLIVGLRYVDGMSWEEMSSHLETEKRGPRYYGSDHTSAEALKKYFQRYRKMLIDIKVEESDEVSFSE